MKKIFIHIMMFILTSGYITALSSCVRVNLESTENYVVIRPENKGASLPALVYHFYNKDGKTSCLRLSCDGSGVFSGYIPFGEYQVIATNTNVANTNFTDMEEYETATVQAHRIQPDSRAENTDHLLHPGDVYSVSLENLFVYGKDTIRHYPSPVLLTKKITLAFTLKGNLKEEVAGLSGEINGIHPSVRLSAFHPAEQCDMHNPDIISRFSATAVSDRFWSAEIRLFGICDPQYGENYRSRLRIALSLRSGNTIPLEIDLTDILSDVMAQNQGVTPVQLPLSIEMEYNGIELTSEVTPWNPSGGGEVEIPEENFIN